MFFRPIVRTLIATMRTKRSTNWIGVNVAVTVVVSANLHNFICWNIINVWLFYCTKFLHLNSQRKIERKQKKKNKIIRKKIFFFLLFRYQSDWSDEIRERIHTNWIGISHFFDVDWKFCAGAHYLFLMYRLMLAVRSLYISRRCFATLSAVCFDFVTMHSFPYAQFNKLANHKWTNCLLFVCCFFCHSKQFLFRLSFVNIVKTSTVLTFMISLRFSSSPFFPNLLQKMWYIFPLNNFKYFTTI